MEDSGISIQPGELYIARTALTLQTILGSCVSVTFWSKSHALGAMCHGVLPKCPASAPLREQFRYVDSAIRYLLEQFDASGAKRKDLEIKAFGGADVLAVSASQTAKPTVGALNCKAALEVLQAENLSINASDLGGSRGRVIYFDTGTGEVLVKRLASHQDPLKTKARDEFPTPFAKVP